MVNVLEDIQQVLLMFVVALLDQFGIDLHDFVVTASFLIIHLGQLIYVIVCGYRVAHYRPFVLLIHVSHLGFELF